MTTESITIWNYIVTLKEGFVIKGILAIVCASITSALNITPELVMAMVSLMGIDLITGVIVAKKVRKEKISSKGMWNTTRKMVLFFTLMLVTALMTKFHYTFDYIHNFTIAYIAASEGLSILENLSDLGLAVPKVVVDKLKELTKTNKLR